MSGAEHTRPGPTAAQTSGKDAAGGYILSVLAKRTYDIAPDGTCAPSAVQAPLVAQVRAGPLGALAADTDLFPIKPATDVIVVGEAGVHAPQTRLVAGIRVAGRTVLTQVTGDRRCTLSRRGEIVFSEPEPFDRIPLVFERAYGGRDRATEARRGNPLDRFTAYLPAGWDAGAASPYLYPRNPVGRGYLVEADRASVEELLLPNLEDPEDPLTPDRLVAGGTRRWAAMPMAAAPAWVGHHWFPRGASLGVAQPHDVEPALVPEVARKLIAPELAMRTIGAADADPFLWANGAARALQLPHLRGDELIELANILPSPRQRILLPGAAPEIWTDGRDGRLNPTEPVLHTLVVDAMARQVTMLWRGAAPALRPYLPDELAEMPLRVLWP